MRRSILLLSCFILGIGMATAQSNSSLKVPVTASKVAQSSEKATMLKDFKPSIISKDKLLSQAEFINRKQVEENTKANFAKLPEVVRVKPGSIPLGVEYLGKGYNVHIGKYADPSSLLRYVLDIDALIADGHIGMERISEDYYRYTAEESISKYSQSNATSIGVSGSYGFFKGSVNAAWSSSQQSEYGRSFASVEYKATLYKVYINPAVDLRYYLTETYKKDLKTAADGNSYGNLITNYGSHVLCCAIMGGKLDYYTSTDYSYNLKENKSRVDVEASFNAVFASAKIKIGNQSTTSSSEYTKASNYVKTMKPAAAETGGEAKWMANMKNYATMIDFQDATTTGSTGLKLLYEVSKNAKIWGEGTAPVFSFSNNSNYKSAYEAYAKGTLYANANTFPEIDGCITGLALYKSTEGSWEKEVKKIDSDGKSWWIPIGPAGGRRRSYYDSETRYVLYARVGRSSASRPPVVRIGLQKKGISLVVGSVPGNSYNLPDGSGHQVYYVPLYGQTPKSTRNNDLNAANHSGSVHFNVHGSVQCGDDLVLWYMTSPWISPTLKPIMQLRFSIRSENPVVYFPKNLQGDFSPIQKPGGGDRDTAEGYQNYKAPSNNKYREVYGENYLEYSYDK